MIDWGLLADETVWLRHEVKALRDCRCNVGGSAFDSVEDYADLAAGRDGIPQLIEWFKRAISPPGRGAVFGKHETGAVAVQTEKATVDVWAAGLAAEVEQINKQIRERSCAVFSTLAWIVLSIAENP
jgi:hypothetical protein